ncbi:hypothetical protein ACM7Z6_13415 [Pseudomonas aeruginosa]
MTLNPFDKLVEQRARSTPIAREQVSAYFAIVCKSGCDRVPLKVRNLAVPFYFAGYSADSVYLAHAETCMVSQFAFDDLELLTLGTIEEIQQLIEAWLDSAEGAAARELIESATMASQAGIRVPVTLRWPEGGHTRQGHLCQESFAHAEAQARWVCAIETAEGKNVVFRYGLTRIARAMHDGKTLSMVLKPGTTF